MKIYIANESQQQFGGGFSFLDNFSKLASDVITDNYEEADIFFVAGASMIKPERAEQAKKDGKKVVLRVDNFLKHTRNGGKGMSRMKSISHMADLVIYQSKWARDFLCSWTTKNGPVILNGVDTDLFKPSGRKDKIVYLYSRYNKDDSKHWVDAQYYFMREWQQDRSIELWLVGRFSDELRENNFDFYNGENFRYLGIATKESMAAIYQNTTNFLYTYFADACSNTLIEALVSGCHIPDYCNYYLQTGGAPEIISKFRTEGREYFSLERMVNEYKEALGSL